MPIAKIHNRALLGAPPAATVEAVELISKGSHPAPGSSRSATTALFSPRASAIRSTPARGRARTARDRYGDDLAGRTPRALPGRLSVGRGGESLTIHSRAAQRYRTKVTGPLLDRIEIHLEVPRVTATDLYQRQPNGEDSRTRARTGARGTQAYVATTGSSQRAAGRRRSGRTHDAGTPQARNAQPGNRAVESLWVCARADHQPRGRGSMRPTGPRRSATTTLIGCSAGRV